MLTEGWDVKNVFQIVPHEQRAFNSKLLISQVLGRGLRIPDGLKQPIYVKINNHEKWTSQIENLYKEILEIENRISWKYDERRSQYLFPLYNITYESYQETIETKEKPAKDPDIVKLMPQEKKRQTYSKYSVTGTFTFDIERKDIVPIEQAAREVKLFLKSKDERISGKWPLKKIQKFIETSLKDAGQETTYISFENLAKIKQAFGPMFRETGKPVPRMKLRPDTLYELHIDAMPEQSFNESAIKNDGYLFYSEHTITSLTAEHQKILKEHLDKKQNYEQYKKMLEDLGQSTNDIEYLNKNLFEINEQGFKTPLNMVHVSYNPEYRFTTSLFQNGDLIDSFIKSPDKGFYNFPYSYKPSELGSTHVKRENCNPDFFLKKKNKNHILVVEMKDDRDIEQENKAKYRDGKEHFEALNIKLQENNLDWEYFFYFLSPEDISSFFQAIRENRYQTWNSRLMQELS
jgi:type III restriction enzyme